MVRGIAIFMTCLISSQISIMRTITESRHGLCIALNLGLPAVEDLVAMVTDYFGYGYFGVLLFLAIRMIYVNQQAMRYICKRYPEEGRMIRSYEWQWYPWSVGRRTLRALIDKQSVNDPELALWAKKADRSGIYFLVWFGVGLIVFFVSMLLFLAK